VEWNPVEAPLLATGGFDSQIIVTDVRLENHVVVANTHAEIETLHWLPAPLHNLLLVSFEDGSVHWCAGRLFVSFWFCFGSFFFSFFFFSFFRLFSPLAMMFCRT
jgi:hypothetical protein